MQAQPVQMQILTLVTLMPNFTKTHFPQTVWETALPLENESPALILRGSLVETHLIPIAWKEGWGVILIFFPALIHLWLFLPAPCLSAALQTSRCSPWPTWDLIQFSCNKQVLSKNLFIFTWLIVFVHLFYCTLCFTHDLGIQLSSTAYAAQRQFQCQCGTVFSFLPFAWAGKEEHLSFLHTSALPLAACGWLCFLLHNWSP